MKKFDQKGEKGGELENPAANFGTTARDPTYDLGTLIKRVHVVSSNFSIRVHLCMELLFYRVPSLL